MKRILYTVFGFGLLASCISILHAEVRIEITNGIDLARPIGVIPPMTNSNTNVSENISEIIASDLRNSGKFNPLDDFNLPQHPNSPQEVQPEVWSALGVYAVIIIQLTHNILDDSYKVAYQLIDTGGEPGAILSQNLYQVNKKWLRYISHTISDEVFEKLTGIKGAFRTRIAYVSHDNNNYSPYELYVSDYDGYNKFLVYRSSEPLMSPAWSPDGTKLAYVTFEGGNSALVIQTLVSGTVRKIVCFPRHNGAPALSPDGTKLAFALSKSGSLHLYIMDCASGQIRQITDDHSNNTEPAWFPDSQHLAFTSDQIGRPQIYKININNGIMQRITWEGLRNQNADISKDGKFMVMVNSTGDQQHIARQNLETGDVQILSSTLLDETPSLSPNGMMVIYSSSQGLRSVLNLVSIDGRFKTRFPITEINGQIKFPAWSPYLQ